MLKKIVVFSFFCSLLVLGGCAGPYVKAQMEYYKGDPEKAEAILKPAADECVAKNAKEKNLMLWDLGVYRFAQGNFDGAIEAFMQGVKDVEELHSAGQTVGAALTSAGSQKYVGDPIEISMAYLYIGMCYYMKGDFQNALVGFRRSLEEDLSKEQVRQGDMGITNYMMGETYFQTGRYDDAVVAFRKAVEHEVNLVPAHIGLYQSYVKLGNTSELEKIRGDIKTMAGDAVASFLDKDTHQGMTVAIFSGIAPKVQADAFLGAFRTRNENKHKVKTWELNITPEPGPSIAYLSDEMMTHYSDQGGLGGEVKKQATRAVISTGMKAVLGFGLSNTNADIRYWPTLPGYIYIAYAPLTPGKYCIEVKGRDNKDRIVDAYSRRYDDINISEGKKAFVVLTSFGTISSSAGN